MRIFTLIISLSLCLGGCATTYVLTQEEKPRAADIVRVTGMQVRPDSVFVRARMVFDRDTVEQMIPLAMHEYWKQPVIPAAWSIYTVRSINVHPERLRSTPDDFTNTSRLDNEGDMDVDRFRERIPRGESGEAYLIREARIIFETNLNPKVQTFHPGRVAIVYRDPIKSEDWSRLVISVTTEVEHNQLLGRAVVADVALLMLSLFLFPGGS